MTYSTFAIAVVTCGLRPRQCNGETHWQILGGQRNLIVNVWPNGKRGFRFQADQQKARRGSLDDAIKFAGPLQTVSAPGTDAGLIRRLLRWMW